MDSSRAGTLRIARARLHGRINDPLLLRSRPTSASLHRRDHFNLRLGHRSSPRITPSTCPNDSALQGGPHRVLTEKAHKRGGANPRRSAEIYARPSTSTPFSPPDANEFGIAFWIKALRAVLGT